MTNITTTDIGNIKDGHLNLGGVALTTWEQWEPSPGIENRRHPWNLALPPKSDEEIQTQRERVERDGQLSDILVHSDMLFDGYYELMACLRFNIKPRFRDITAEYIDEGLLRLWADRNFHPGRHTTDSQRAAIAYCIHEGVGAFMSEQRKLSIPQVAAMMKVSRQTLDNVRNALNVSKCPALIELLLANTISVHAAQKAAPTLAKMSNEDRSAKVKSLMAAGKTANRKHSAAGEQSDSEKKPEPIRNRGERVGRNDPCPCGSGKKYKNCHMKLEARN